MQSLGCSGSETCDGRLHAEEVQRNCKGKCKGSDTCDGRLHAEQAYNLQARNGMRVGVKKIEWKYSCGTVCVPCFSQQVTQLLLIAACKVLSKHWCCECGVTAFYFQIGCVQYPGKR